MTMSLLSQDCKFEEWFGIILYLLNTLLSFLTQPIITNIAQLIDTSITHKILDILNLMGSIEFGTSQLNIQDVLEAEWYAFERLYFLHLVGLSL